MRFALDLLAFICAIAVVITVFLDWPLWLFVALVGVLLLDRTYALFVRE